MRSRCEEATGVTELDDVDDPTPIALSRDVPRGAVIGTRLGGQDLAVWRDPAGSLHVWTDRCPHRGMRLSLGFLRDGQLACPYHGWRFDAQGHCVHIPANPNTALSAVVAVRRYPVGEAGGLVWLGPVPDLPAATAVRSVTIRCGADDVRATMATEPFWTVLRHNAGWSEGRTPAGPAVVGWQSLDGGATALHLAVVGAADPADLAGLADQAARLRDRAESALVAR
jgi:phenylpropionate dioxygenase-like ring-hydroxylating dioxygenase large terminal subunit